jgi:hypothetical protein
MAQRKKPSHCEIKRDLRAAGVDFQRDFLEQPSSKVDLIVAASRRKGYRKPKNAPGSHGRMYYQLLQRQKGC